MSTASVASTTSAISRVVSDEKEAPLSDFIIGRSIKTHVLEEINHGSFGRIHRGILLETNDEVVVKLEEICNRRHAEVLLAEGNVFRKLEGGPGIPKVYWFGVYEPYYNGLVLEYLGPSIQELFAYCDRKFSLKTILMLIDQIIDIFKHIHDNGYVYRDVKPDNFLIGRDSKIHRIYIVDFGLAMKIQPTLGLLFRKTPSSRSLISYGNVGTPRYASIRAHGSTDIGPADDLEAFAYVCMYLFKGSLPWQGLPIDDPMEKRLQIKQMKLDIATCDGMPDEFSSYLQYVRDIPQGGKPNHKNIKDKFVKLAARLDIVYDFRFDWVLRHTETGIDYMPRGLTDQGHNSSPSPY